MKLHQFAMAGAAFMLLQALSAQDLAALLADKTSGTVELPAGSYQIEIWYANYNNEAELATNVEDRICVFNLEIAQPIEE